MYTENQEASNNFRLGFALSNRTNLHGADVVSVCDQNYISSCIFHPVVVIVDIL